MVHASGAELLAESVSCREAEVGESDAKSIVETQNVFWLQVTMINTERMAIFDCVEQL